MKAIFKQSPNANPNYLATICRIESISPIEGADRLVSTVINGYNMIIPKDMRVGDVVVYFPCESCINSNILSANNLYAKECFEKNSNAEEIKRLIEQAESTTEESEKVRIMSEIKTACGFFSDKGRVRILKLRGQYSQGFVSTPELLVNTWPELAGTDWGSLVGTQFDTIDTELIVWKYVVMTNSPTHSHGSQWKHRMSKLKRFDRLIPGTFEFHYDTKMLAEHIDQLKPDDIVTITVKLHGTSGIFANIPTRRNLSTFEKIKKFLHIRVQETEFSNIYSSRTIIKNQYINNGVTNGFYDKDVWAAVNRDLGKYIDKNMTVYGEIVGYVEGSSTFIQKNHDYGCKPGTWKFMPYRIVTVENGQQCEWNVEDVRSWTQKMVSEHADIREKLLPINILYHGPLKYLYADLDTTTHWHENLLARMKQDKQLFGMELDEPMCKNKVPREGIVIRIDNDQWARAWKLKTLRHYGKEAEMHDAGEADMEETA